MRIIPYIRILWAITILLNLLLTTSDSVDNSDEREILFQIMSGLVTGTFVLYCVLMGIQELTDKQFIQAIFFNVFGIIFEVMIFVGVIYILRILGKQEVEIWRFALLTLWQIGLFALILVDIKKLWTS